MLNWNLSNPYIQSILTLSQDIVIQPADMQDLHCPPTHQQGALQARTNQHLRSCSDFFLCRSLADQSGQNTAQKVRLGSQTVRMSNDTCTNTGFRREKQTESMWDDDTLLSDKNSGQTGG